MQRLIVSERTESAAGVVAKAFSNCMTDWYVSQATRRGPVSLT